MTKKPTAAEIYKKIMRLEFKELPNGKIHQNGMKEREKPCNLKGHTKEDLGDILLYIIDRATRLILRKVDKSYLPEILDRVYEAFYEKDALIFFRYGEDSVDVGRLNAYIDRVTMFKIADYHKQYGIKTYITKEEAINYAKEDIHSEADGRIYVYKDTKRKTDPIDNLDQIVNTRTKYEPETSLVMKANIMELFQIVLQTEGSLGVKIMYMINLMNKCIDYKSSCKDLTSFYSIHELDNHTYNYIRGYLTAAISECFDISIDNTQMTNMLIEFDKLIYTMKGKTYVADHQFHLPKEVTIRSELCRFEKKYKLNVLKKNNHQHY